MGEFGNCSRVFCNRQAMLPIGISDLPGRENVKLYCPGCRQVYNPRSSRYKQVDGAYWGTSFPHMMLMVHPGYFPAPPKNSWVPKMYGFKIHDSAAKVQIEKAEQIQKQAKRSEAKVNKILQQVSLQQHKQKDLAKQQTTTQYIPAPPSYQSTQSHLQLEN